MHLFICKIYKLTLQFVVCCQDSMPMELAHHWVILPVAKPILCQMVVL